MTANLRGEYRAGTRWIGEEQGLTCQVLKYHFQAAWNRIILDFFPEDHAVGQSSTGYDEPAVWFPNASRKW
ncbi:MAG: hypothetical protein ACYCY8_11540 [Burkholderiales bacterium]